MGGLSPEQNLYGSKLSLQALDPRQGFMVYPRHWKGTSGPTIPERWAYSSAGEHLVDIEGVTSSILVTPTISLEDFRHAAMGV